MFVVVAAESFLQVLLVCFAEVCFFAQIRAKVGILHTGIVFC